MDCTAARALLDQGVVPGPQTPSTTQLGFHLARCPACREYRAQKEDFLLQLLMQDQPSKSSLPADIIASQKRAASAKTQRQPVENSAEASATMPSAPAKKSNLLGQIAGAVTIVLLVGLFAGALWLNGIRVRTLDNIASFVVTPVPASASGSALALGGGIGSGSIEPQFTNNALDQTEASLVPEPSPSPEPSQEPTAEPTLEPTASPSPTARILLTATPWPTLQPAELTLEPTPDIPPPPAGEPFTVLVLGNDKRPQETGVPRTDAMMLVRIDPQSGHIALVSFPRDLWVVIPGYGQTRINAAYVWGEVYGAEGGGLGLAKRTVSNLIGRDVDYVMMVDFEAFIGLIDSIGGITVDVEKELDDPRFPTMDYGYTHAHFSVGPQQMDGVTALTYSRIRHPDSDFMRIRRQQTVLIGIAERLQQRGDFQNLISADTITASLRGYVQTDMPQERILAAVWALRNANAGAVQRYTLSSDRVSFGVGNDAYAIVANQGSVAELTRLLYGE